MRLLSPVCLVLACGIALGQEKADKATRLLPIPVVQLDRKEPVTYEKDGRAIGFAYYAPTAMTDQTWYLYWIAVDRTVQARGRRPSGSCLGCHLISCYRPSGGHASIRVCGPLEA